MLIFDIDDTISPTQPKESAPTPGETARAGAWNIFIPAHILEILRSRDDIALLSTWGEMAEDVPKAFGFQAKTLLISDYSDKLGIKGKFEVIKQLKPAGWADDHITPTMKKWCEAEGIATVRPRGGYIAEKGLATFLAALK